jgi:hypothetical protein
MIHFVIISALVIMAGGAVFYRSLEALSFAFGVLITSSLNIGKIYLLEYTVKKTVDMGDVDAGKNFVKFQYMLRYFGTAIVLLGVGLTHLYSPVPIINIWGAVIGLFTLQIAVIIVRMMKLDAEE